MPLDARILLAGQGVQAPDMLENMRKGQVLQNLAQIGQMQQIEMMQRQRADTAARGIGDALGSVDPMDDNQVRAALGTMDPEARAGFLKYVVEHRKSQAAIEKDRAETGHKAFSTNAERYKFVGGLAGMLADNPDQRAHRAAQANLARVGIDPSVLDVPEGVDPGAFFRQLSTGSLTAAQQGEREDKAAVRKQTAVRDQNTQDNYLRADARARDMQAAQLAHTRAMKEVGMAQAGATRGAAVDKRTTDVEMKLADDYKQQSKGWQETATAIGKVRKALETATSNPGSALAAGTAFMKILDPNSVVRESELGMALNASGWFDRARNTFATLQHGRIMTAQQAKSLREAADALFAEAAATQRQIDNAYRARTKQYGGDPNRVIIDLGQGGFASTSPSSAVLKPAPAGSGAQWVYTPSP